MPDGRKPHTTLVKSTFKVGIESDYTETRDSHNPTSSQRHRPIIPLPNSPNDNCTGKLWVRVYPWVGSGSDPT